MTISTPTAYDEVAFKIIVSLQDGEKNEDDIEHEMFSIFSISSEIIKDLLHIMKRLELIYFNENNNWSLTTESLSLIESGDSRLDTLISSFQFGELTNVVTLKEDIVVDESELDDLEILRIETEHKIVEYNNALRLRLKEILLKMNPYRFEEVVIELLVKSGEGKLGITTSKSNDGGIDGYIFQSYLKQGPMAVQTKRYAENLLINKKEIHEFMSVCRSEGVRNGYFVTTSSFS
ncbi:restriction endonuclease, partial [Priestia endophytica]|uniref:restriction endonuclease n=1 Tax=Priestia endophytica TaxID=135735 RepID=UPI000DCA6ABF